MPSPDVHSSLSRPPDDLSSYQFSGKFLEESFGKALRRAKSERYREDLRLVELWRGSGQARFLLRLSPLSWSLL